ncbi:aldose 1-epimerase [Laceyella putida]|uniref:Aldose 1-epimerase n=1 Tax=Laceyella putida TaxID=110101 RepID=A0ABW2RNN2_9BACL
MAEQQAKGIREVLFHGVKGIELYVHPYAAVVLPEVGGNLVSFRDVEREYAFIREPQAEEMALFAECPLLHGIPVLFPPNRYEDGAFQVAGQAYRLPITEPAHHNHIHGFFFKAPWGVSQVGETDSSVFVELVQSVDKQAKTYAHFPHLFEIRIRYALSTQGLEQHVAVTNQGSDAMPCMLGFHTSISAPFAKHSTMDDMRVSLTIGERIELSGRMLPTGNTVPLQPEERLLKQAGVSPFFAELDHHYSAEPQAGSNRMVLTDLKEQVRFIYDAGTKYRFWMMYNGDAKSGFFCPEPQTNMVNAPNVPLSAEQTGLVLLEPGETWSETSRFFVEEGIE